MFFPENTRSLNSSQVMLPAFYDIRSCAGETGGRKLAGQGEIATCLQKYVVRFFDKPIPR
jgi:hypothetical protein